VKRFVLAAAGLLLLAPGPLAAAVPDPGGLTVAPVPEAPSAPPTLAAVIDLLKKRDYPAALKGAREFVKAQPGNVLGHEVHGVAAQANRLFREAEAAYTEALRLEPTRVSVMARQGALALDARDYKKAETWFRRALAADADSAGARRGLATALMRQRRMQPAAAELQEALRRSNGTDLEAKLQLAQLYHDVGRTAEADALVAEVLATAPDHLPALLFLGLLKLEAGKSAEAEAAFEKVIQRDPKAPGARMGLAIIERSRGNLVKAVAEMEALAKERPDWPMAHLELGRTLLAQKKLDPALRAFDRAEQTSVDPAVTRVRVAQILAAAGERDRAIAKAQASVASTNAAPGAHALLARLYLDKGAPDLAERELQSLVKAVPNRIAPRMQLARFYMAQRRPADAVAPLEEAANLSPNSLEPLGLLVDAYLAQGKGDLAVTTAERMQKIQGDTALAYLILGVVYEKAGRAEPALAAYQQALDKEPHHPAAARARASLLEKQQRLPEARQLLEATAAGRPPGLEPLVDLAQLEERAGNPAAAVTAYRRALERAPDNPLILNNLAYLLTRDAATQDEAVALAEKAMAKAPDNPAIADTLGWALYQKGELARAEALLTRVAKAAPGAGEVRYHLGLVYAKQGKTEEARRELEAAVKAGNFKAVAEARQALEALK
jgi:tetratricopeptide (TPR) repeat protein